MNNLEKMLITRKSLERSLPTLVREAGRSINTCLIYKSYEHALKESVEMFAAVWTIGRQLRALDQNIELIRERRRKRKTKGNK
jgi:hypothetical protein